MNPQEASLLCLPGEIWQSSILLQLSLFDMCRLDTATASRSLLTHLRTALAGTVVPHEVIITPGAIQWVTSKQLKLLRVRAVEEVYQEELLLIAQQCPQLISLSTWDFEPDAQAIHYKLEKRRKKHRKLLRMQNRLMRSTNDEPGGASASQAQPSNIVASDIETSVPQATTEQNNNSSNCDTESDSESKREIENESESVSDSDESRASYRSTDEATVVAILQYCPHLKCLKMSDMTMLEWCKIFVRNIARLSQLDDVIYQEADYSAGRTLIEEYIQRFSITHTSFKIEAFDPFELRKPLLHAVAAHYPLLTNLWVECHDESPAVDSGVLGLARCCTELQRVMLRAAVHPETLWELCRLRPHLIELKVTGFVCNYAPVLQAIQLMPGNYVHTFIAKVYDL